MANEVQLRIKAQSELLEAQNNLSKYDLEMKECYTLIREASTQQADILINERARAVSAMNVFINSHSELVREMTDCFGYEINNYLNIEFLRECAEHADKEDSNRRYREIYSNRTGRTVEVDIRNLRAFVKLCGEYLQANAAVESQNRIKLANDKLSQLGIKKRESEEYFEKLAPIVRQLDDEKFRESLHSLSNFDALSAAATELATPQNPQQALAFIKDFRRSINYSYEGDAGIVSCLVQNNILAKNEALQAMIKRDHRIFRDRGNLLNQGETELMHSSYRDFLAHQDNMQNNIDEPTPGQDLCRRAYYALYANYIMRVIETDGNMGRDSLTLLNEIKALIDAPSGNVDTDLVQSLRDKLDKIDDKKLKRFGKEHSTRLKEALAATITSHPILDKNTNTSNLLGIDAPATSQLSVAHAARIYPEIDSTEHTPLVEPSAPFEADAADEKYAVALAYPMDPNTKEIELGIQVMLVNTSAPCETEVAHSEQTSPADQRGLSIKGCAEQMSEFFGGLFGKPKNNSMSSSADDQNKATLTKMI